MDALYIVGLACACAALWYLFHEYLAFRTDELRQRLFRIRDDLFMAAVAGQIAFDAPAYGVTRITLNGMIRYAHQMSLIRFLVAYIVVKRALPNAGEEYRSLMAKSVEELPSRTAKKLVLDTHAAMNLEIGRFLLLTSPIVLAVTAALVVLALLRRMPVSAIEALRREGQKHRDKVAAIDAEAYELGLECSRAA